MKTKTVKLKDGTTKTFEVKDAAAKIDNSQLLADSGLRILHINGAQSQFGMGRSMTIAYDRINRSHLKIATAVCHTKDTFCRKIGTKLAIENFQKGNTVIIPIQKGWDREITGMLRSMFDLNGFDPVMFF